MFLKQLSWFGVFAILLTENGQCDEEEEAAKWFAEMDKTWTKQCHIATVASWDSGLLLTPEAEKNAEEQQVKLGNINTEMQKEITTRFSNWKDFKDKRLRKAFKVKSIVGTGNMSSEDLRTYGDLETKMTKGYNSATVCKFNDRSDCTFTFLDIADVLEKSENLKELEYYWTAWHDKMSEVITPEMYKKYVDVLNKHAAIQGQRDYVGVWLDLYDDGTAGWTINNIKRDFAILMQGVSEMYDILHAYIRMKLRKIPKYKPLIEKCGYIPAHITGNMWAQDMMRLENITKPFPKAPSVDATDAMIKQGYTQLKMFQESDKFFKSLGLKGVTESFWKNSLMERPADGRPINCHPMAWDMCEGKGGTDYRIMMCAKVNSKDFGLIHHEMGHLEYMQQFQDLEHVFRGSANPGFHEAIGDSLALAVTTPNHLQCELGLDLGFPQSFCENLSGTVNITESDINYLYFVALDKLIFLPFAFAVDFWRWGAMEGTTRPEDYNKMWWKVRKDFEGVVPPNERSSPNQFDPGAKYHVAANVDYIRYFVSHLIQFQIYEAMCIAAGEFDPKDPNTKPLFQCDFTGNKYAGKLLADMLKMGSSRSWPDAMQAVTGGRKMSATSFKNYLQPVLDYMEKKLKASGEVIGFGDSCDEVKKRNGNPKWADLILS